MNKNKSVLAAALAAAALGSACSAMAALTAFTNGNFTGSVDISGTVTVPQALNHWQWAAGDPINFSSIPVTQMDSTYKILTLPAATNLPLLVGQTIQATVGNAGNAGINPQITFTNAANTTVIPTWDTTGNSGKGTITLPVTAADNTPLGSVSIRVKAAGLRAQQLADSESYLDTTYSLTSPPQLYGATALPSQSAGVIASPTQAAVWAANLGSKNATDLLAQLNAASGFNVATWTGNGGSVQGAGLLSNPSTYFAGTYGLGIAQGDNIVVTFTNPVTTSTNWKAPLKMTVTYL